MFRQKPQYHCPICRWQGTQEPTEPGEGTECPNCGSLVYPQTWSQTWGVALLFVGLAILTVLAVAYYWK